MVEEVSFLKKDFKQQENKYLEDFLDMKSLKEKVKDKLIKQDQSLQTIHMLCRPKPHYNELNKVAIGYKNPLCLTRVNSFPNASGSQPKSHVKLNRISPAKRVNNLLVEDQPRTNKSHLRTSNRVDSSIRFENDHFGAIMGYGDYVIGDSVISRVYYVEGLGHNLFSVRQFCDSDPEVAFRKHSCYVRDTDGVELIKGSCRKDLVRSLPRLKFEKDHLCSACQLGKIKKHTHKPKAENTNLEVLNTIHMDLYGPMRVKTINGKKYILVIVDDYSRFTWVKFLRSKDETPEVIIKFITQIQVGLNKTVRYFRTDNGIEFVNHTLTEYYERIGIFHQKTVPRTPQQNGVVERQNRTLVEAARTMLIFSKALMFLWAEEWLLRVTPKTDP
nr:hypothetical protein [Tanacetum cinerariifolium]